MAIKSLLLAGVGGQGVLRASDIISMALMSSGYDVKKSEVHGMAQRGGCVTSHVRYGRKVYSPIAKKGDIDLLLSFEKLETLRYLDYMRPGGIVIINNDEVYPPSVNLGLQLYPQDVIETVTRYFEKTKVVNGVEIASRVGNLRTVNSVMIGALSNFLEIGVDVWERILNRVFPLRLLKDNLDAFHLGRSS